MLIHLFEMQQRKFAWSNPTLWSSPLVLKHRPDENCDSRNTVSNLQHSGSSLVNREAGTPPQTIANHKYKHSELDTLCSGQEYPDRQQSSSISQLCAPQPANSRRIELTQAENACQRDVSRAIPSGSQSTRSEPTTRSNSVDCEKDVPPNQLGNRGNDAEPSKASDLTVPNCKLMLIGGNFFPCMSSGQVEKSSKFEFRSFLKS